MKTYQIILDPLTKQATPYVRELIGDEPTGVMHNRIASAEYLKWIEQGNTPEEPWVENVPCRAKYFTELSSNIKGIRYEINGAICFVPLDPANADYQRIMQLVDSGQLVINPAE